MRVHLNTLKRLVREVVEERQINAVVKNIDDIAIDEPWIIEKLLGIRDVASDVTSPDIRGIVKKLKSDDAEVHELPDGKLLLRFGGDDNRTNYVFDWSVSAWNEVRNVIDELGAA
jgi:hypothetical protein